MNTFQRLAIISCSLIAIVSCKSIPLTTEVIPVSFQESQNWSVSDQEIKSTRFGQNIFAWSNEVYSGDLEISFTAKSDKENGEISFVLFGSGTQWEEGLVIVTIASDYRAIRLHSIYEGGLFLDNDNFGAFGSTDQHDVRVVIKGKSLKVYLDGEKKLFGYLSRNANRTGKIGFFKYWDRPAIEISNLVVKQLTY